jgi:hypothetical protein
MFGIRICPMCIMLMQPQMPLVIGFCDGCERMGAFRNSACVSASAFLLVCIFVCSYCNTFCVIVSNVKLQLASFNILN